MCNPFNNIKCKLLRYNNKPELLDLKNIARISGVSQSNVIIIMKDGTNHTGYLIQFE